MKYTKFAHTINIIFIALLFIAPTAYCFLYVDVPYELGLSIILMAFVLTTYILSDFYGIHLSNSVAGIAIGILFGAFIAACSLLGISVFSSGSLNELALLGNLDEWLKYKVLLIPYMLGLGIVLTGF